MRGWAGQVCRRATAAVLASLLGTFAAHALTVELKDVASDRVERQRAFAIGSLPLPGTPDLAAFAQRLEARGLRQGDQVFIRIFKAESELELWMRSGSTFKLLDTYPICHWSGTIGPKIHEGDKQTPEGFYDVTRRQLHLIGRHPRSLNLGFPNAFDKLNQRTGSYILVHGGCSSVGCFAMTNAVVTEIYDLVEQALKAGQEHVPVHVFPFRMTEANMQTYGRNSEWMPFWRNLKEGYDAFEQTRVPPQVGICEKRYSIQASAPGEGAAPGPLAVCGDSLAAVSQWDQLSPPVQAQLSRLSRPQALASRPAVLQRRYPMPRLNPYLASLPHPSLSPQFPLSGPTANQPSQIAGARQHATMMSPPSARQDPEAVARDEMLCDLRLSSCRKWLELRKKAVAKALAFHDGAPLPGKRRRTAARGR